MEILPFWKAPGWGDKTTEAYEVCGYRELTEKYQVPFWDMQKDKGIERDCRGMKLNVCERAANIDFLSMFRY